MKLQGKVVLITGGGTGIGSAIAQRFIADGALICIAGRRQEYLDKVAELLPPEKVLTCCGDVSKSEDIDRMIATVLTFAGRLDVLVNNAGVSLPGSVTDMDLAAWQKTLDVNLTGPFLLMKAAIPHMIKGGGGSIINISSVGGLRCLPARPAYCTSKAGLIMLTQQAALDYGSENIRCNVVCPGVVKTPMIDTEMAQLAEITGKSVESFLALAIKNVPLQRPARPDEISGLCSYLASDDSSFMTGSVLVLDGGSTIVDVFGATVKGTVMG